MAMPCLSAIAGALPPDYVDSSLSSTSLEKTTSVDQQGNFEPKPISTAKCVWRREGISADGDGGIEGETSPDREATLTESYSEKM